MKKQEFFMAMIPPTITAQEHKVRIIKGKPVFYDPPELAEAKEKLTSNLSNYTPDLPFEDTAVRLVVKWCFRANSRHLPGEYKKTKPDTDNLQKMLKDCMTKTKFWKDDALVASEICEKLYSDIPGIYIRIEEIK